MHLFDRDMALKWEEPLRYTGRISQNWMINSMANGGYVMALMTGAMMQVSDKGWPSIVTATYISRCLPGGMELKLEQISSSKQFTRLQSSLYQEGRERVRVWGTFLTEGTDGSLTDRYEAGPPEVAPIESCIEIPAMPAHTLLENLEMKLDPSCAGWLLGELSERSEQKGWVSFREERPYDPPAVIMLADSIAPPFFVSHGRVAWVPTIELSVNIRNLPQSNRLKFSLRSRFFSGGLVEEDGEIWDEAGNLIAISRQIAQIRKGAVLTEATGPKVWE